ncbi:MAG TPA: hypothetical protein VJX92_20215 [Methylomirabilota bacterium]|nr:hypothetical protein [Methylomirabilota bacterium]
MDHAGGLRANAAEGATIVTGKGTAEHFRRVLAAPYTRDPDLPVTDLTRTPIVEVADQYVLNDGQRQAQAFVIDNPHADGMMIGYVSDARDHARGRTRRRRRLRAAGCARGEVGRSPLTLPSPQRGEGYGGFRPLSPVEGERAG